MKTVVFTSSEGGVGTTTLAFLSAYTLANQGYRVVLLDCNPIFPALQDFFSDVPELYDVKPFTNETHQGVPFFNKMKPIVNVKQNYDLQGDLYVEIINSREVNKVANWDNASVQLVISKYIMDVREKFKKHKVPIDILIVDLTKNVGLGIYTYKHWGLMYPAYFVFVIRANQFKDIFNTLNYVEERSMSRKSIGIVANNVPEEVQIGSNQGERYLEVIGNQINANRQQTIDEHFTTSTPKLEDVQAVLADVKILGYINYDTAFQRLMFDFERQKLEKVSNIGLCRLLKAANLNILFQMKEICEKMIEDIKSIDHDFLAGLEVFY